MQNLFANLEPINLPVFQSAKPAQSSIIKAPFNYDEALKRKRNNIGKINGNTIHTNVVNNTNYSNKTTNQVNNLNNSDMRSKLDSQINTTNAIHDKSDQVNDIMNKINAQLQFNSSAFQQINNEYNPNDNQNDQVKSNEQMEEQENEQEFEDENMDEEDLFQNLKMDQE